MTSRQFWMNVGEVGVLIALLGFVYWQHSSAKAVPAMRIPTLDRPCLPSIIFAPER